MILTTKCISQTHLKRWYMTPKSFDMTLDPPTVGTISGSSQIATMAYNGAYDRLNPNGSPMFYIKYDEVFNRNNVSLGFLSPLIINNRTSEISIVPLLDNDACIQN